MRQLVCAALRNRNLVLFFNFLDRCAVGVQIISPSPVHGGALAKWRVGPRLAPCYGVLYWGEDGHVLAVRGPALAAAHGVPLGGRDDVPVKYSSAGGPKKKPRLSGNISVEQLASMTFSEMESVCVDLRKGGNKEAPNPRPRVAGKRVRLNAEQLRAELAAHFNLQLPEKVGDVARRSVDVEEKLSQLRDFVEEHR